MVRESRRLRSDVRTKTFVTRYSDTSSSSQNRHPGSSAQSNNRQAVRTGSTPNNSISTNSNAHPSTSPATSSRANPRIVTKRTRSKSCNGRDRSRPQSRNPSRRSSPEPKRGRGRPRNRSDRMGSDDEDGSPVSHRTRSAANSRNVSPDPLSRSSIRTPKRVSTRIRSPSASSRSRSRSSGRRMNSGPSSRRASPSRIRRRRPSGSDNEYGAPVSHRTRSRQASAANSRNASPERPSRSTIRTPRPVDGSSVSTRTRSSSAVSRTRSRSSGRRMDSGRSSRRSSPSPVRRQRPSTSDGDFFKSIEEIFGELSPDEKKEFRKENRSEIDEYLKERSEKDVQIDWGFPPNIEKRLGNVSSMESIQSEEKFLLDAGVDVEKVKRWKANKMYEVESALKLKMKSAERFGKLNKERKLFSDLSDSGKALKMLILRERAPMKSEVQLLVRRLRVSLVPIQNEIEKQRDLESALRVELFNENVPQEKQKKMFADSQCPNFSDFQRKCSSDGVFIQSLKWAWKTVIVPTKKFKEAHAHLLTLEKVYQEKLGPGQAWEEKDFKRMEQITQIKVETLKSWLQQRRKQDEEHIIDPLYAKTSLYSEGDVEIEKFSKEEKRRWELNLNDKVMYEDVNKERRKQQRQAWEKTYPFYKYLGERVKYLEELVDRPRPPMDIEVELFGITVDFFRITKAQIEDFLLNERRKETELREEHYIKFQPNTTSTLDDVWSKNPDLKEFYALTSGIPFNSNVLRIAWLEHKKSQSADVPSTSRSPPISMPQMSPQLSPAHSERGRSADAFRSPSVDTDDHSDSDYEDQDFGINQPSTSSTHIRPPPVFDAPEYPGIPSRQSSEDFDTQNAGPSDMMTQEESVMYPVRPSPASGLEEDEAETVGAHEEANVDHPEQAEEEMPQEEAPEDDEDLQEDDEAPAKEQPPHQSATQPPQKEVLDEATRRLLMSNSDNPIQPEPILPSSGKEFYLEWKTEELTDWMRQVLVNGGHECFGRWNGLVLFRAIYDLEIQEWTGLGEPFWDMIKNHLDKFYSYAPIERKSCPPST